MRLINSSVCVYAEFLSQSGDLSLNIITMLFEAGVLYVTVSSLWNDHSGQNSSNRKTNRLSLGALCLRQSKLYYKARVIVLSRQVLYLLGVIQFAYVK